MKRVVFNNKIYYYSLITILIVLLVLNIIQLMDGNWKMLIPIIIQIVLLFLIFSKNYLSKIAIKIWLIVLLITGGIQIFTGVFYLLAEENSLTNLVIRVLFVTLEILLLINIKSIVLVDEELS